jgi:hypothetical protein
LIHSGVRLSGRDRVQFGLSGHVATEKGDVMGKEARIALLLAASACLLAVMVDWAIEELG